MPDKSYTLFIFEQADLRAMLVLIPNARLDETDHALFKLVHNMCLNADTCTNVVSDGIIALSNALCSKTENLAFEHPVGSKWAMRFTKYIVDAGEGRPAKGKLGQPIEKNITHVYRAGWF